jgi:hypothetical protein
MLGSVVLDVVIGLMLIYLLLSSICSALNELIAATLATRAQILEQEIVHLLGDPDLVRAFYDHPLVQALFLPTAEIHSPRSKPHYVDPKLFSHTLIDILTPAGLPTFHALHDEVVGADVAGVKKAIRALMGGPATAEGTDDAERLRMLRVNIEDWYNGAMERLSGWYKRRSQRAIFFIALTISILFNVDTLVFVGHLTSDPALRAAAVAAAQQAIANAESDRAGQAGETTPETRLVTLQDEIRALQLPVGWDLSASIPSDPLYWVRKVVGLLLTTAALTMGGPFWFDLLSKLVNIRATGHRPPTDRDVAAR